MDRRYRQARGGKPSGAMAGRERVVRHRTFDTQAPYGSVTNVGGNQNFSQTVLSDMELAGWTALRDASAALKITAAVGFALVVVGFATFMLGVFLAGDQTPWEVPVGFGLFFLGGVTVSAAMMLAFFRAKDS